MAAPLRACLAGALALASLVPSTAQAFCRGVTATPPLGYDPVTQGCFGEPSQPGVDLLYWKNACVGYSLQRDASATRQITLQQATQVAAEAFAAWSQVGCAAGGPPSIKAVDEGPVDCSVVGYNKDRPNQHVIVFRDDAWPSQDTSNTLGLTTITYDAMTGEIFDADIEINSHDYQLVADGPAPAGAYDLLTVLTHEAGHFLGLAHSADVGAVMFAHYQAGSSALTPDDVSGICTVYPPDGTRVTSAGPVAADACDPTPRHGFSTACDATEPDAGTPAADGGDTPGSTHKGCAVTPAPRGTLAPCAIAALFGAACFARRSRGTRRHRARGRTS
jgi:hypothetical protein